jgi:hypothetical protein
MKCKTGLSSMATLPEQLLDLLDVVELEAMRHHRDEVDATGLDDGREAAHVGRGFEGGDGPTCTWSVALNSATVG